MLSNRARDSPTARNNSRTLLKRARTCKSKLSIDLFYLSATDIHTASHFLQAITSEDKKTLLEIFGEATGGIGRHSLATFKDPKTLSSLSRPSGTSLVARNQDQNDPQAYSLAVQAGNGNCVWNLAIWSEGGHRLQLDIQGPDQATGVSDVDPSHQLNSL